MIEAIGAGTIGRGVNGADRSGMAGSGRPEGHPGPRGGAGAPTAGPVGPLLTAVAGAVGAADPHGDGEFRAALLAELVRRYRRMLRGHARSTALPRVWQAVLDRWETGGDPVRTVLAGTYAVVEHDLAPAVVSACTLLGRAPGRTERAVVEALLDVVAGLAQEAAAGADAATRADAAGLALMLGRGEGWRQAEHLWMVRGRPSEAAREHAALDWRAELVARSLLGGR